jgi:hypothetical protein
MMHKLLSHWLLLALSLVPAACAASGGVIPDSDPSRTVDGYRGIWFELGQKSEYGDKYSGGLGTYTSNHIPLAIHAPEANKTFFVYGGTTEVDERHLLAMIGYYDHGRDVVSRPTVVHDKQGVDDPHDNPTLTIDGRGHLWVFVNGRGRVRPGYIYRSRRPYSIDAFELIREDEMAYPQPWWVEGKGFLLPFTRYTDGRELYWSTSPDGRSWSEPQKLVSGGHYQVSTLSGGWLITAFNTHIPAGNVDTRTNLYLLQTGDLGRTWRTIDGTPVSTPLDPVDNPALVRDYRSEGRLVYLMDITVDRQRNPVVLYLTSTDHRPGPGGDPRTWTVARWTGSEWRYSDITTSTHNYDVGSLYIEPDGTWRVIGPTEPGPQQWGTGGEMAMWVSRDEGGTWAKAREMTRASERNHTYSRRPINAHPDFYAYWADGDPDRQSISRLYFSDRAGNVRVLPYEMDGEFARPERVPPPARTP